MSRRNSTAEKKTLRGVLPVPSEEEEMQISDQALSDDDGSDSGESSDGGDHPLFDALSEEQFDELLDLIGEYVDDYEKITPGTWEGHWHAYCNQIKRSWKRQKC